MKIRTCLLFACMIVVPLLAMFSHKIPPEFRRAVRERAWEPAWRSVATAFDIEPPAQPAPGRVVAMPPAETVPAPAAAPPSISDPAGGLRGAVAEFQPEMRELPASTAAVAVDRTAVATVEIRTRQTVEERLAALGAISFDCQPVQGGEGVHRCSCRMAADPTGQLQRVFQSSGPDPVSAMTSLLDQVTTWKQRIALEPAEQRPRQPVRF